MTGFLHFPWPGNAVAIDEIIAISAERDDDKGHAVRSLVIRDKESRTVAASVGDSLLRRPSQIIPALPETYEVECWIDGEEVGMNRTPVIAWALCLDGECRPVTPQGVRDDNDRSTYVEMPDGSVQSIGEHADVVWFDSVAEFVEHEKQRLLPEVRSEDAA